MWSSVRLLALMGGMAAVVGCAHWDLAEDEEPPSRLPQARMSPDSVVLQIAFVHLPAADEAKYDEIWSATDEQGFDAELRRLLVDNGFRCGVLGRDLPVALRDRLDAATHDLEDRSEDVESSDTEVDRTPRRMQCRAGRRAKIVVSKTHPELSILTREGNAVRGRLVDQAQCLFAVKPYPQGDGQVKLSLTPEIEHGEMKSSWSGQNGTLMQRMSKERVVLDNLHLTTTLAPGQILVLSATAEARGLGEHFFMETANGAAQRTVVLVRLAHTQHDDLFAPEQITTPLATPAE